MVGGGEEASILRKKHWEVGWQREKSGNILKAVADFRHEPHQEISHQAVHQIVHHIHMLAFMPGSHWPCTESHQLLPTLLWHLLEPSGLPGAFSKSSENCLSQ